MFNSGANPFSGHSGLWVVEDQKLYPFGVEAIIISKWWTISLLYLIIKFFCTSKKMLVERDVVVILKRKTKTTKRDPLEF